MKKGLFGLGVSILLALSGCSLFENPSAFKPVKLQPIESEQSLDIAWRQSVGSTTFAFKPMIVGNVVYAASRSGYLAKYELSTGRMIWSKNVGTLSSGVGADENVVAVTDTQGMIHVYDASTGESLWEAKASSLVTVPPAVASGVVIVHSVDARVEGYNAQTGEVMWGIMRSTPKMNIKLAQSMLVRNGFVYSAIPNGRLIKINPKTGQVVWETQVDGIQGPLDLESAVPVLGEPSLVNNQLCLGSYQGALACYRGMGMGFSKVMNLKFPVSAGVTQTPEYILVSGMHGKLMVLNAQNGELVWSHQTLKNRHLTNPVIHKNLVLVGDYEGYIHGFSLEDGHAVTRTRLGGSAQVSQLQSTPYGTLIQTGNGELVMIRN